MLNTVRMNPGLAVRSYATRNNATPQRNLVNNNQITFTGNTDGIIPLIVGLMIVLSVVKACEGQRPILDTFVAERGGLTPKNIAPSLESGVKKALPIIKRLK